MPVPKGQKLKCGRCNKLKKVCACGRPSKKNEETVKKLVDSFKEDFTVSEACISAGISEKTFYTWCKDDEKFLQEIQQAKQYVFIKAKKVITNAVLEGSVDNAKWLLERRQSNRYATRQKQEVAEVVKEEMDEEERDALDKLLEDNIF